MQDVCLTFSFDHYIISHLGSSLQSLCYAAWPSFSLYLSCSHLHVRLFVCLLVFLYVSIFSIPLLSLWPFSSSFHHSSVPFTPPSFIPSSLTLPSFICLSPYPNLSLSISPLSPFHPRFLDAVQPMSPSDKSNYNRRSFSWHVFLLNFVTRFSSILW